MKRSIVICTPICATMQGHSRQMQLHTLQRNTSEHKLQNNQLSKHLETMNMQELWMVSQG